MANKNKQMGAAAKGAQAPTKSQSSDQAGQEVPDKTGAEQPNPDDTTLVDPNAGGEGQGEGEGKDQGGSTENPPVTEAKKDSKQVPPPTPPTTKSKFAQRCEAVAQEYAPHYPASKAFHFCSDMQVFLEGDKADANAHQLAVNPKIKVFTVNL